MADQVQIILQGSSKQLEASIKRIEAGLNRLSTKSVATQRTMQAGAQRTAKSIDKQNRSVTLLVAKFALLAFAVQTVANIINSTFGAVLKTIDEFQVAAIGTAAAVTSIARVGEEGIGAAFNQNLNAALATFEKLEIVAAQFFSTGQELQLAFNTLAQRGVVIREDEFSILGKITDQIKLLTGGQNTQIQIQQELRAILDGNVRTTTAFGKALQARGVDIQQLSREVRATGSLEPFAPFLDGLDAAGPAIRRTLSSVTATFKSLFNILARNIFQETFDGIVASVTEINNTIIEQRDLIIQVGIFIKNEIGDAWDSVSKVTDKISSTIIRIVQNDMVQFATAIVLVSKLLKRGPLGIFLAIAGGIAGATGEVGTFGHIINILVNSLALGFEFLLRGLEEIFRTLKQLFEQLIAFTTGGFDLRKQISNIQTTEDNILSLRDKLEQVRRQSNTDELFALGDKRTEQQNAQLEKELNRILGITQALTAETAKLRKQERNTARSSEEGADFIADRGDSGLQTLRKQGADLIRSISEATDKAAGALLPTTKDELDKLLDELIAAAKGTAIPVKPSGEFTESDQDLPVDLRLETAASKAARKIDDIRFKELAQRRKTALNEELADIDRLAAAREITGLEAFNAEQTARQFANQQEIAQLEEQILLVSQRAELDRDRIEANRAGSGDQSIDNITAALQVIKSETDETKKIAALTKTIADLRSKGAIAELDTTRKITDETREINRLLAQRDRDIGTRGGTTSADRLAQVQADSRIARDAFAADNLGDQEAIDRFNLQQDQLDIQEVVRPQVDAFRKAIDDTFKTLIDAIVTGSLELRDLAETISQDLIKSGLEDLIENTKKIIVDGLEEIFEGVGIAAAGQAAQALALGIGLLLAVLSRIGNEGDFTASGGTSGGIDSSGVATRGLVGGDTALPIAEINEGLQEALIPTNAILSAIELNTRPLAGLNLGIDPNDLAQAITAQVQGLFSQALLQT